MEYVIEITEADPDEMDFMQMVGAAPRMGVAMDIFAVNPSASEKIYELAGHVYEDGSGKVKFVGVTGPKKNEGGYSKQRGNPSTGIQSTPWRI